jgi:hypothetical protein
MMTRMTKRMRKRRRMVINIDDEDTGRHPLRSVIHRNETHSAYFWHTVPENLKLLCWAR